MIRTLFVAAMLARRTLLAGLAVGTLLHARPALADAPVVLGSAGLSGTLSGSGTSAPFTLETGSILAFSGTFGSAAAGALFLERSYDGGATWAAYAVGSQTVSVLTATGFRNVLERQAGTLFRLRAAMTGGSVGYALQSSLKKRTAVLYSGQAPASTVTYSPAQSDQSGALSLRTSDTYIYDSVNRVNVFQPNDFTAVEKSTDGGTTWTTAYAADAHGFSYAVNPGPTPTLWRMKFSISSTAVKSWGIWGLYETEAEVIGAPPLNLRWESGLQGGFFSVPGGVTDPVTNTPTGLLINVAQYPASDGVATVTVTRLKTDGSGAWEVYQAATKNAFTLTIPPDGGAARVYRLDYTIAPPAGKTAAIPSGPTHAGTTAPVLNYQFSRGSPGYIAISTAQRQMLEQSRWTSLADTDLAGDLTLYKPCVGNLLVKMTVPAAARRRLAWSSIYGRARLIRAEYVDVVSVVDANGNAVTGSAVDALNPSVTYTAGQRTTAPTGAWTGDFLSAVADWGTTGFPTLLEAATFDYLDTASPAPNLTALGL